jgi:hypothetical protein
LTYVGEGVEYLNFFHLNQNKNLKGDFGYTLGIVGKLSMSRI